MTRRAGRRPTTGTAIKLAVVVVSVVLVATALYLGFVRHDPTPTPSMAVSADFTKLPDGDIPDHFADGVPATNSNKQVAQGNQLKIIDGAMTFVSEDPGTVAGYFNTPDLESPVTGVRASWVFRPGKGTMGAIALVISNGIEPKIAPMVAPISMHLVITPINWNFAVQGDSAQPLQVVGEGFLKKQLATDGTTEYRVQVHIDEGEATVDLPDGTSTTVKDPRISQWQGNYATFEVFANHGSTDANGAFRTVWAASGDR